MTNNNSKLPARPEKLSGSTYKYHWPDSEHATYVTINNYENAPFEIFINTVRSNHSAWIAAFTRTLSAIFRRGESLNFVVDELQQIGDSQGGHFIGKKMVRSEIALIGKILSEHIDNNKNAQEKTQILIEGASFMWKTGEVTWKIDSGGDIIFSCDETEVLYLPYKKAELLTKAIWDSNEHNKDNAEK